MKFTKMFYFFEQNGINKYRLYIPNSLIDLVIDYCYARYGHIRSSKCNKLLRQVYFISKLEQRVKD